jgi:N-acetylneuraminate synthase
LFVSLEPRFEIAGRAIGPGHPCYVVAELSGNHGGDFDKALALVRIARDAGADAVKLQTYTPDTITLDSDRPEFRVDSGTLWDGTTLHNLYESACTPWAWQPKLKAECEALGLQCFSSPFDPTAVDFLEDLGICAYKIASFELVDLPLIRRVAATGKPVILSTGMASLGEIEEAVTTAREAGAGPLALLVCSSAYPSPAEAIHLRRIAHLSATFGVVTGLSDHTLDLAVPVAAVAVGAHIIEKHLCPSRDGGGPDSAFSLEPAEFARMVEEVRTAEQALGGLCYGGSEAEEASRAFRRSLFVVEDLRAGDRFTPQNVRSIRPGHGLHPRHLEDVLGRIASRDIERGTPLGWDLVE